MLDISLATSVVWSLHNDLSRDVFPSHFDLNSDVKIDFLFFRLQRDQRILIVSDMSKKGGKDGGGMDKEKELGKLYKELAALRWGRVCVMLAERK